MTLTSCFSQVRKGRALLKSIVEHSQCQKTLEQALQDFKQTVVQAGTTQEADKRRLAFLENKAVCDRAREMMFNALPQYWDSLCKVEDTSMLDV